MKQIICQRSTDSGGMSTAGGYHGFPGEFVVGGTAETQARTAWMTAGTFRNLRVTVDTAPGSGKSWTLEVYKNNTATGLTVTISDAAVTATDASNSFAVASGDYLTLRHTSSGTPTGSGGVVYSIEFESSTTGESGYALIPGSFPDDTNPRKSGVFWECYQASAMDTWNNTNTANDIANIIPTDGAITGTALRLNQSPGGGAKSLTSVIYHAPAGSGTFTKQDGSGATVDTRVTCSGTTQTNTGTYTLNVSAGDRVYYEVIPANTPNVLSLTISIGTTFTAGRDGESIMGGWTKGQLVNSAVRYFTPHGEHDTANATEGVLKLHANPTTFALSDFYVNVETAPGSGKSWEFLIRENGASPGSPLAITVADTETTGSDLVDSYTIASGDTWELRSTPTSTPANSTISFSMVQYISNYTYETTLTGGVYTITGGALTSLVAEDGLRLFINDVDKTTMVRTPPGNQRRTVRFSYPIGGNWSCDFPIFVANDSSASAYRPDVDDTVRWTYNGTTIFNGHIMHVDDGPWGGVKAGVQTEVQARMNRVATDQLEVHNTSFVSGQTLKQALTALRDQDNPGLWSYGVIMDPAMANGPTLDAVTFDGVKMQDAFNRLMDITGWIIRIRPDGVLEAFEPGDKVATISPITAANGKCLGPVRWTKTRREFVNRVHLKYGTGLHETTQTFAAATAGQTSWTLDVTGTGAALRTYITVDAVAIGIGIWGLDSEIWQWDVATNSIRRTPGATGGEVVSVTYDAQYPATITVENAASITADGLWARTFTREDVFDPDEAQAIATGLLRVGIDTPKTITLTTRDGPLPLPGDTIGLYFADRTIGTGGTNVDCLITQVSAVDVLTDTLETTLTCVTGTEAKRSWTDILRSKLGSTR